MVTILKWALPISAALLVASIFVMSTTTKLQEGLIIPDEELAELAFGQKITNPNFSGVTNSGDAFTITAKWALPDGPLPENIELSEPRTTISFENGSTMRTNAGMGKLNLRSSEAELSQGVNLDTTNGYTAESSSILINFETGNVLGTGPVRANGPVGSIEAGNMTLTQDLDVKPTGHAVLVFNNGVKLIYKKQGG
jgi:lipopolysaccharide export system protein LptC